MTEHEWNTCTDPYPMFEYLKEVASGRKLRLFGVACCRRVWQFLVDARSRESVEIAERFADGLASEEEREAVAEAGLDANSDFFGRGENGVTLAVSAAAAGVSAADAAVAGEVAYGDIILSFMDPERAAQADLLREVFGPLRFRTAVLDASSLTPAVVNLARLMYDSRDFGQMPELADVLESAGCTDSDVLDHCRGPRPHVRGCWVMDLVLGKS